MAHELVWERDGTNWPNREASQFVRAGGLRWHVQRMGQGPVIVLLHGTGASTHSWRTLAPMLAGQFTVITMDLPGHGFTQAPSDDDLSLPGMARGVRALLRKLDVTPAFAAGHSAGAAVMIRMSLDAEVPPKGLVSLNGAILPFRGATRHVFSSLAKFLVLNPLVPRLFAWRARDRSVVERLIRDTGSRIEPEGVALYHRLVISHDHVAAALGMMANWDLDPLLRDLPRLQTPLLLIAASDDRTIPAVQSFRVRDMLPGARVEYLRGCGHLAHEERSREVADIITQFAISVSA